MKKPQHDQRRRIASGEHAARAGGDRRAAPAARNVLLAAGGLLALVAIAYVPAFRAGFVMDDDINLAANATLYSADGLWQMWFVPSSVQQYYPLVHTMFWVESRLWGFEPLGYHVVNLVLHGINVLLIWRLLVAWRVPAAWYAAALFAVHPVEVESVVWAVERKNVLSMALALASLWALWRSATTADAAQPRRGTYYALALLLFAAGMFAKTVIVNLPAVFLVILWWQFGRVTRRELLSMVPFFAIGVALSLITVYQENYHVGAAGETAPLSMIERWLVAGRALWFYVGKLLWPHPVMFFYPRFVIDPAAGWQYLFPLAAFVTPGALWMLRAVWGRGPLAAVLIFAGVLMPALGFFNVYFHRFSFVADHFQYHASVALLCLFACAAQSLVERVVARFGERADSAALNSPTQTRASLGLRATGAALLAGLTLLTYRAAALYESEETLYRDTIAKNPGAWVAYSNLAVSLGAVGRFDEGIALLDETLARDASQPRIEFNYGKLLVDRGARRGYRPGDLEQATAHFQEALRQNPDWAAPHVGLAAVLLRLHQPVRARDHLREALTIEPQNVDALCALALVQTEQGETEQALATYDQALSREPQRADAHYGLGQARLARGELSAAAAAFGEAVRLQPDFAAAWNNLGAVSAQLRQFDQAVACFREVVRIDPQSSQAQDNLAKALELQRAASAR